MNFYFITAQEVFGPYLAQTERKARRMWADELGCDPDELPKSEVTAL